MPRRQILIHLRNNPGFSLDDLLRLESLLCEQDGLCELEFDGHDHGPDDSNIFIFSDDLGDTADRIVTVIKLSSPHLNFAVGVKAEGEQSEYDVMACSGISEIIVH